MSEMSARMTLTFNDLGSPGLKALAALIDSLGPKVTGLSNRFNTLERSLERTGTTAQSVTTRLGPLDAAVAKVSVTASNAAVMIDNLQSAMIGLNQAIRTMSSMASALASIYTNLGNAAATAGGQMAGATGQMAATNQQLGIMHGRVTSVTDALRGMAELWVASKLFGGGKSATMEASEFQQIEARIKALNLTERENAEMINRSRALSKELQFVSVNQALEARIGAVTGLGRNTSDLTDPNVNNIIEKTLPAALKVANILQMRGDKSDLKDIVRNLYGLVEARGQTSRPEDMLTTFELVQKNAAATGMKLTTKDLEAVARQSKYGAGTMLSDEGLVNQWAFANQLKASGVGGGGSGGQGVTQAGTAITQLIKWSLGGIQNKETIRLLSAMGLIDDGKVRDDSSGTSVNVAAGAFKYGNEMLRDPIGTATEKLAPIFLKFTQDNAKLFYGGKDPKDAHAQDEAMTKLIIMLTAGQGGVNVGNMLAQAVLPGPGSRIKEERGLTFGAKDTQQSMEDLQKTFAQNVKNFEAALKNLELAMGQHLLPMLTTFLEKAGQFVKFLNDVADANPTAASITAIALAIGALTLALVGLNRMFGIFTIMSTWLTATTTASAGLSGALTAMGASWAAAGGVISGVLAVLRVGFMRLLPLAAAFLIGWDAGSMISSLEVGGKTVHDWVAGFMNSLIGTFERGWIRIRSFFGLISDAQREAMLKESEARQGMVASSYGGKALPGQSASGKIGRAKLSDEPEYSDTPEERMRRQMILKAAGLGDMPYKPGNKDATKKFYNPVADEAGQDRRVELAKMDAFNREQAALLHANLISIEDYYENKKKSIIDGNVEILAALEKRKVALESPPKGRRDEAAITRTNADIEITYMNQKAALGAAEADKKQALYVLDTKIMDVERQAEATVGARHRAEIMRLNEEMDKKKALLLINGKVAEAGMVEVARAHGLASIEYDRIYVGLKAQLDEIKQKEQEVTDAVKSGSKTQFEAEHEVWQLRKDSAALIDSMIEKLKELADASGDPRLVKQVGDLARQAKADMTALSPEVLKVKGVLETSLTSFFEQADLTSGKLRKAVDDFFLSIIRGVKNLMAQNLAQQITKAIFGGQMGQTLSGNSGAGIFNLFSGSSGPEQLSGPGMGESAGFLSSIGSFFSNLFSFDVGTGRVPSDMLAQVHKDEIILNPSDSEAVRKGQLVLGTGGSSAGVAIGNINMNIDAGTGESSLQGDTGKGIALARAMTSVVQKELLRQKLPGGILAG